MTELKKIQLINEQVSNEEAEDFVKARLSALSKEIAVLADEQVCVVMT